MNITVHNERAQTKETITFTGTTVSELLAQLNVNPETVLTIRNNEVLTEDEILQDKDSIDLLSVISGG